MRHARVIAAVLAVMGITSFIVFGVVSWADVQLRSSPRGGRSNDPLIVHEWGTFTSFSGSDSVKLEFRPLVDNDLPPFVLNRSRQEGALNPFIKSDVRALQRMETPVTYFYTKQERQVNVRVGFPEGLLTEFYPPVKKMQPAFQWSKPEPIRDSMLDWGNVWLLPVDRMHVKVDDAQLSDRLNARLVERLLPSSVGHDHYGFARETDSAFIYVERPKDWSLSPQGAFFEKFLFYRGIGNFELPLKMTAHSDGRFEVVNLGAESIRSLFLLTVDGDQLQLARHDELLAGEQLTLTPETPISVDELSEIVVQALVDERLYEKEARAMVKTWRESWFGEQGTRLFYMLPQANTDKLLPLEIEPRPDALVRVMVGRLEIMRPEDEAQITAAVNESAMARIKWNEANSQLPSKCYALPDSIVKLGRLAEPALLRVKHLSKDGNTRNEANQLLAELRSHRDQNAVQ